MKKKPTYRPRVEALEDRCVPALLLQFNAANQLIGITGVPDGDVNLTFANSDVLNVNDNGVDLGTFPTGSNLNVALGAVPLTDADLNVNLNTFQFNGNLALSVGNAANGYDIAIDGGSITGSLNVTTGSGADLLAIGQMAPVLINEPVAVSMGAGIDTLLIANAMLKATLSTKGVNNFNLDTSIVTELNFNSKSEAVPANVTLNQGALVQGNALVTTGNAKDIVSFRGVIQGNAFLRLKDGNDQFTLTTGAMIQGALGLSTSRGADKVFVNGTVVGDLLADLGVGNDAITFDGATAQGIGIYILPLDGNDVFTIAGAGLNAANTNLVFVGCNGNHTVNWVAVPTLVSAYLDGGLGDNQFTAGAAIPFPITLVNFN